MTAGSTKLNIFNVSLKKKFIGVICWINTNVFVQQLENVGQWHEYEQRKMEKKKENYTVH